MPVSMLLDANNLQVAFDTPDGVVEAVCGVDFQLADGESLGIVGESGSGKSQAMLGMLGLLERNGRVSGTVRYRGAELVGMRENELRRLRGASIAMIFQDPMTALNPYLRISTQMTEVLVRHRGLGKRAARRRAVEMLEAVRIPAAARRIRDYPHQFSGGMRQRVMIAMALLCEPDILVADEPTTALDVTVQAEILDLIRDLRARFHTAMILITHDLGVVAGTCERLVVMRHGGVVESGAVDQVFRCPQTSYTRELLAAVPRIDAD